MIEVRPASSVDAERWLTMRCALWPDESRGELEREVKLHFAGGLARLLAVFVAVEAGKGVRFAELNIRPYAEGCATERVAFLEGWYVEPHARRAKAGAALITAAEAWARRQGCVEFASDALYENALGRAAHVGVGFEEVEAIRCFRKQL